MKIWLFLIKRSIFWNYYFSGIGIGLYNILVDENALSIKEKEWLDDNKSKV